MSASFNRIELPLPVSLSSPVIRVRRLDAARAAGLRHDAAGLSNGFPMLFLQIVLAAVLLLCRAQIRVLSHFSVDTKAWSPFATIPQEFSCTLAKANQAVQDNFNAAEHLPDKVFPYLNGHLPAHVCNDHDVCSATQALSNGASIMLWSQQPSPLAMLAFHVANAQKRKSRLLQAAETLIEVADDTLESTQDSDEGAGQDGWGRSSHTVQAKSICLQSFTFTELFFRCSADYPQVETTDEKDNKDNTGLWQGQALHLDEAYEFLEGLALLGPREKAGHQDRDSICYSVQKTYLSVRARPRTPEQAHPNGEAVARTTHVGH